MRFFCRDFSDAIFFLLDAIFSLRFFSFELTVKPAGEVGSQLSTQRRSARCEAASCAAGCCAAASCAGRCDLWSSQLISASSRWSSLTPRPPGAASFHAAWQPAGWSEPPARSASGCAASYQAFLTQLGGSLRSELGNPLCSELCQSVSKLCCNFYFAVSS